MNAHLITFSCYRREPRFSEPARYETFAGVFEQVRRRHSLRVYGYVLMPEHVRLLTAEPPMTLLATVWKAAKQESEKKRKGEHRHFWQAR